MTRNAANGRIVVYSCARADLASPAAASRLPAVVEVVELPCTGRISVALLVAQIARGAAGVLVVGRHQSTCRFDGAEEPARERTARASLLLGLAGVAAERVRFVEPAPGPEGPVAAVQSFVATLAALGGSALAAGEPPPEALYEHESLDAALALCGWMIECRGSAPPAPSAADALRRWLERHGLPAATPGGAVLLAGRLPMWDLAGGELFRPVTPPLVLAASLAVLARLGAPAGVALSPAACDGECFALAADTHGQTSVEALIRERASELPRPPVAGRVACVGEQSDLVAALGYQPVEVESFALPTRFALTPDERREAAAYLARVEAAGARALYVANSDELFRWAALTRHGAWQSSFVLPATAAQLAQLSMADLPLSPSFLATPLDLGASREVRA